MSNIRKYFTSRFGDWGKLMEFDFGQLEVVALAHLSQDAQLIADIENGIDIHVVNAAKLYKIGLLEVTPKQRFIAKRFSFMLQYGSGYKSMAKKLGVEEDIARRFIDLYYKRYSGVKKWQDDNINLVRALRTDSGNKTPKGYPQGVTKMKSDTGRIYTFKERDVTYGHRDTDFYNTEIKNYPVQGFATGDIVPLVLGKVYRAIKQQDAEFNEHVKMINTVHDSIVFDINANRAWMRECYHVVKPVMEAVPEYLWDYFEIDFTLPIKVDCKVGKNWMDMKDYKPLNNK